MAITVEIVTPPSDLVATLLGGGSLEARRLSHPYFIAKKQLELLINTK